MKFIIKHILPLLLLVVLNSICGCKKFIEVEAPTTSTNAENVYTNDATAAAVLTGIYSRISATDFDFNFPGNITGISAFAGLSADELTLYGNSNNNYLPFFKNDLSPLTQTGLFWQNIYPLIFIANSAIEGISDSKSLSPLVQQQLLGEAKFIRAFCYFYLVNLYGDIPLVLTSDWKVNSLLPRSSKVDAFHQMVTDLEEAKNLLSSGYLKADAFTSYPDNISSERVRPTKWAAAALLARVYLYIGDWQHAELESSSLIAKSDLYKLPALSEVFVKNSEETIWALQPVNTGTRSNTGAGAMFVLPDTGPNGDDYPMYLSDSLVKSFDSTDARRTIWIDSVKNGDNVFYYAKKYKIGKVDDITQEYIMMLRLAEQFLIRAEAKTQKNDIDGARADINAVRARAGLAPTSANDKSSLLQAIENERRTELFTEWGDRWLDLKRRGELDELMISIAAHKQTIWKSHQSLYPIPQDELSKDVNLVQNPGY